jgi:O-antigen ligase
LLLAAFPRSERLGSVLVFAGFVAVAAISDTVGSDPAVQEADVHFSPFKFLAYGLLLAGTLTLLLPTGRPTARLRLPQFLVLGYLVCSGIGAVLGPEPLLFIFRWLQVGLPFLAAVAWWRRRGSSALLVMAVLVAAGWHVLAASVSLALGRSYLSDGAAADALSGDGARLGGLVHPTLLALSAAVIASWALWLILTRPPRKALAGFVALPFAGMALGFSRGRTGFLALLAMGIIVAAVARRRRRADQYNVDPRMFLVIAVCLLSVVASAGVAGWFVRGNASEVKTLTNRTRLWDATFQLIAERPVLGWGPGLLRSGKVADKVRDQVGFVGHAHNALLDAILAGGLVGGSLWLLGFLAVGRALFRRRAPADDFAAFLPCLWAGLATWGVVEGNLSGFGFSWLLFLALTVAIPASVVQDSKASSAANASN